MNNLKTSEIVPKEKSIKSTNTTDRLRAIQEEKPKMKWSLQVKMMLIISGIFILASTGIITIATYLFKSDNELRTHENNLKLADIVSLKIETDIDSIIRSMLQLGMVLRQFSNPVEKDIYFKWFFQNESNIILITELVQNGNNLDISKIDFSETYLEESGVTEEDIKQIIIKHKDEFAKSFSGKTLLHNISPSFNKPVLALSYQFEENKSILLSFVKMDKILKAFEKTSISDVFMINDAGILIAHPDISLVLSAVNYSNHEVVKSMKTSIVRVGQKRFMEKNEPFIGSYSKLSNLDGGVIATVSEEIAYEAVYQIQRRNVYIVIIALCMTLIVVFLFAKSISIPILKLLDATIQIGSGNFKIEIQPSTKDEVGVLTSYFIQMGKGLEEREKVKSILGSMIDPTVVQEAMKDMAALKRGDEKMITSFFSDIAGFSTISEQLKSVDLASLLNEYLSAMTILLKKHDGVLDKYIGDAIVGIFSAPVDVESHELKACKASLEMITKLTELREIWTKNNSYIKDAQNMDIRIGLNTGLAKVGFMGTDALASYTMMGNTVNVAARLEAAGKDYGVNILIGPTTKKAVEEEMFTRAVDLVRVKGINTPLWIYELISTKSDIKSNIKESTEIFENAFQLFLKREWDKSIEQFSLSQKAQNKKDKAVEQMINRCMDFKLNPPSDDWDGVYTRKTK